MPYIKDIDLTHRVLGFSASSPLKYFIYLTKEQNITHILNMLEKNMEHVANCRVYSCNSNISIKK